MSDITAKILGTIIILWLIGMISYEFFNVQILNTTVKIIISGALFILLVIALAVDIGAHIQQCKDRKKLEKQIKDSIMG